MPGEIMCFESLCNWCVLLHNDFRFPIELNYTTNQYNLLMKRLRLLCMSLVASIGLSVAVSAETISNYTVNFDDKIETSDHAFKVAPNWKHIVDKYEDEYGFTYYMTYSYRGTGGRTGGGLYCGKQEAGDGYDNGPVTDVLVTPEVSGDVVIYAKAESSSSYVEIYSINEDGSKGEQLVKYTGNSTVAGTKLSTSDWTPVSVHVDDVQRLGIRPSYVTLDDFSASTAEIALEPAMKIETAEPSATTGVLYWNQKPDGSVEVKYTVTVTNTGQTDLVVGQKGYSVSIINGATNQVYGTVKVPQDLKMGETSQPFDVVVNIADPSTVWSYSYSSVKLYLRENLGGAITQRTSSQYVAYESKFVFRQSGTTTTSSLSGTQSFGVISEATTKNYEIYNDGIAPLTVKSITIPEGFTAQVPEGPVTVEGKSSYKLDVTQSASTSGTFSGDIIVVYDKNGTETTYTLPITATVIAAGTWVADFDSPTSTIVWPDGCVAQSGIRTDYSYVSATKSYNCWLRSYTSSSYADADNKFITPKLHAEAGDVMTFDVATDGNVTNAALKVYLSKDRENWGEAVAVYPKSDLTSTFANKSITIAEAGDYYVGFAVFGVKLDNIVGLQKVDGISHDVYYKAFSVNDEYQTGSEITPSIEIIPILAMSATDYTVKLYANGQVVSTATSKDLKASPNTYTTFNFSAWTPQVEKTTVYETYAQVEFTDGTVFKSPVAQVKVTCEPYFVFFDKGTTVGRYAPVSRATAITFGRGNESGVFQEFEIYNWGMAPLTVKSISVSEGYSVNTETPLTVASKERQEVKVTFAPETPGVYKGKLEVVYVDADGQEQTFALDVNGTFLDPAKWYVSFDDGTSNGMWPAGSLYQNNISKSNGGTSVAPNFYITSMSKTDNMFITPMLHAQAGEELSFDAVLYSSSWSEGQVDVYAAPTRDALGDESSRRLLGTFSGKAEDVNAKIGTTWQTFNVKIEEDGDYYLGFVLTNRVKVDELYGLSLVDVAHDWILEGVNVPQTAMQNVACTAQISLRNIGLKTEQAGEYTVTAHVGDKVRTVAGTSEIATVNSLKDAVTPIDVKFMSSKEGTYPVYFQIKAGDYTVTTEPVDVTFALEQASSEIAVGTPDISSTGVENTTNKGLLHFYDKNSTAVALYTPDELHLNGGEKIKTIRFRGRIADDIVESYALYYEMTDDVTEAKPAAGEYDTSGMTQILDLKDYQWKKMGTEAAPADVVVVNFDEPIVYEAGKSIRIVSRSSGSTYKQTYLVRSTKKDNNWCHANDNATTFATQTWSADYLPMMYLTLEIDPVTLSGKVENLDKTAAEGAVVTLVSDDEDEVQYTATTDAEGKYEVNVIQNGRTYSVTAAKDELMDYVDYVEFKSSMIADFTLMPVQTISNDSPEYTPGESNIINVELAFPAGLSTVAMPFELIGDEIDALFGTEAKIHYLDSDDGDVDNRYPVAHFNTLSQDMQAGVPYLVYLPEAVNSRMRVRGKALIEAPGKVETATLQFVGVFTPTELQDGMIILDNRDVTLSDDQVEMSGQPVAQNDIPMTHVLPFHAYISARPGYTIDDVDFVTDSGIISGVENIAVDRVEDNVIYNLQGIRVTNPGTGIYIVNGKKVFIRR